MKQLVNLLSAAGEVKKAKIRVRDAVAKKILNTYSVPLTEKALKMMLEKFKRDILEFELFNGYLTVFDLDPVEGSEKVSKKELELSITSVESQLNIKPAYIVASGRGYHVYYISQDKMDKSQFLAVTRALAAAAGGDKQVASVKRYMRLPYSINDKNNKVVQFCGCNVNFFQLKDIPSVYLEKNAEEKIFEEYNIKRCVIYRLFDIIETIAKEKPEIFESREMYLKLLYAAYDLNVGYLVADKILKHCPGYNFRQNRQDWESFWHKEREPETGRKFICYLVKTYKPELFQNIIKDYPIKLRFSRDKTIIRKNQFVKHLNKNYKFMINNLTSEHMIHYGYGSWVFLNELTIKKLYNNSCRRLDKHISFAQFELLLNDTILVDEINPLREQFNALPPAKSYKHIEEYCSKVKLKDESQRAVFEEAFKVWFSHVVRSILTDEPTGNWLMFILTGGQGIGKSTFFNSLKIPGYEHMFVDEKPAGDEKDLKEQLFKNLMINWEELEGISKRGMSELKNIITRTTVNVRLPYRKASETYNRKAVMCGSTNDKEFLMDLTGNRRFLIFEIESFDYNWVFQMKREGIWDKFIMQMYREIKDYYEKNPYGISQEIVEHIKQNERFREKHIVEEVFLEKFIPVKEDDAPAGKYYTITKILKTLKDDGYLNGFKTSDKKILKQLLNRNKVKTRKHGTSIEYRLIYKGEEDDTFLFAQEEFKNTEPLKAPTVDELSISSPAIKSEPIESKSIESEPIEPEPIEEVKDVKKFKFSRGVNLAKEAMDMIKDVPDIEENEDDVYWGDIYLDIKGDDLNE